jgi:hypothetical protein
MIERFPYINNCIAHSNTTSRTSQCWNVDRTQPHTEFQQSASLRGSRLAPFGELVPKHPILGLEILDDLGEFLFHLMQFVESVNCTVSMQITPLSDDSER